MDLINEIKKRASLVDENIDENHPILKPIELYESSKYLFKAGGKRLRAVMLLLVAEAIGKNQKEVLPLASSVELIHNFTLIHDDIMDNDDMRRGMPSAHIKWGIGKAILSGDVLYSKAFELLAYNKEKPLQMLKCIDVLSKACVNICEGQWMDVEFEDLEIIREDEYLEMIEKKTAVLFGAAAYMGAIGSGASDDVADALYEYGRLVGISFQIWDDVLDLTKLDDKIGKPVGSDLLKGKKTIIAIHALNKGVKIDIFGKGAATKEEIYDAIKVLEDSGSIEYAKSFTMSYINDAKAKLDVLEDSNAKNILMSLADYVIDRNY